MAWQGPWMGRAVGRWRSTSYGVTEGVNDGLGGLKMGSWVVGRGREGHRSGQGY